MVYGFVKQSGGLVRVESQIGRGTSIKLYFPEAREARPTSVEHEPATLARGNSETILLVEDEPALLALAKRLLEELGYRVVSAENGPAALTIVNRGEPIDLLLTDIVMPDGMSGRQLAAEVRARHPGLPVVYMSGYPDDAFDRAEGSLDAELVAKPYERSRLASALHDALRPVAK
jgi:CheY-like chemotaxis protein